MLQVTGFIGLLITDYRSLFTVVGFLQFTVHRSPFTDHTIHRSPFTDYRSPITVHQLPFTVHYPLYVAVSRSKLD